MIINTENVLFYKLFYICNQNPYEIHNQNENSCNHYLNDCVCNLYRHSSRRLHGVGSLVITILVGIMRTIWKAARDGG